MGAKGRRGVVPFLMLVAGVVFTIYGALYHRVSVVQLREQEVSIPIPTPFSPDLPGPEGQPFPGEPPLDTGQPLGMPPAWQPPPAYAKVIQKTSITTDELEPVLLREASVGGVMLADSGQIQRTYSGDAGPALCPT